VPELRAGYGLREPARLCCLPPGRISFGNPPTCKFGRSEENKKELQIRQRSGSFIMTSRSFQCSVLVLILTACQATGDDKRMSFAELKETVDRRVADWQPTADEKRFDQIGWCTSLLEAEKLAREHQRPVFLFTHDGRMNVGRC
jgi:hypothetical protein